jgi:DNA-binding NtrC family response regulator
MMGFEILVVDDDADLAETLRDFLAGEGYSVGIATSGVQALQICTDHPGLALVLVDLVMPQTDGLGLMRQIHDLNHDLPIVIMTGFGTIETAVDAIKSGAEDYMTKPFDREAVRKKVGRLMELHRLRNRVAQLEANLRTDDPFQGLIYVSQAMQKVVDRARAAAASEASVLLLGETGTGKEKIARAIHSASSRSAQPFVAVNCGALPRELVESELFGARRGAYTGAYADSPGLFAAANRGTVFLDEIGEMPKEAQVTLLRILQEKELRPLGSARAIPSDVRVLAATNRPLAALRQELLREDLYFRLATVVIEIPPLRRRPEDILVFAQWFVARLAEKYGRHVSISGTAVECLLGYGFPGNVRELQNLLESTTALSSDDPQVISERDIRPVIAQNSPSSPDQAPLALDEMERLAVERAIRLCRGNRTKAAALLGISRDTLYRKIRDLKADAGL